MIVLTNTIAQELQPGQSIIFDETVVSSGCGECHRNGTGTVFLNRANGSVYDVHFSGNVTATAASQLSIQTGGAPLPETTMMVAPQAATTDYVNVSAATAIKNTCGYYNNVTVTNTGTDPLTVAANSCLYISRIG